MHVALRVDASAVMGTGHLQRCLSLAHALVEQGAWVTLVTRALDGVGEQVLRPSGLPVIWLAPGSAGGTGATSSNDLPPHHAWAQVPWQHDANETCAALRSAAPDWVVVDHYAFDARWHDAVRQGLQCRVLVIDDTADRALSPDILLDHNWAPDHRAKYQGRLTKEPVWLPGPRFALLSAAYRSAPRYRFNAQVRSIGIFMGGTDPGGITAQVLQCVRSEVDYNGPVEVVSTSANPHLSALRAACAAYPDTTLTLNEPDLSAFFARHDLQIGAGGGATWERCCIGVPTIALVVADNQAASLPGLHALGALRAAFLSDAPQAPRGHDMTPLSGTLHGLFDDAASRERLCATAAALVDGRGAQRVALRLMREVLRVRPATLADAPLLYAWRNHVAVRGVSRNETAFAYEQHLAWLKVALQSHQRNLLVGHIGQLSVGCIRFDRLNTQTFEVSLYLDPDLLGLGLGRQLLLRGEQRLTGLLERDSLIHAEVLPGNQASASLFESCKYQGGPTHFTKVLNRRHTELESTQ
jgi:UDP-2,4-diacetamido-2,4,6-trideoxy-beta-L-altropyranose hydrolase